MNEFDQNLNNVFGDIDLELLDLILKGFFADNQTVLDAGCGEGRNLIYFLQRNFDVHAIDPDKSSVELVKYMFQNFGEDANKVKQEEIIRSNYATSTFDAIICSRVLHFCESENLFFQSWNKLIDILKPGGLLYLSMDSMIDFSEKVVKVSEAKWQFRDGSVRFLLTEELVSKMKIDDSFDFIGPIKTIHYGAEHAQSVLCLKKISS